ncbi:MAG: hypothetical protein IJ993_10140, partial [Akkermansia sp.]|nr:hypothetical protein [Akkermansia sp.]
VMSSLTIVFVYVVCNLVAGNTSLWKVLRSRPQPPVVDIAASAGAGRILFFSLIVNQIHPKFSLFLHLLFLFRARNENKG